MGSHNYIVTHTNPLRRKDKKPEEINQHEQQDCQNNDEAKPERDNANIQQTRRIRRKTNSAKTRHAINLTMRTTMYYDAEQNSKGQHCNNERTLYVVQKMGGLKNVS